MLSFSRKKGAESKFRKNPVCGNKGGQGESRGKDVGGDFRETPLGTGLAIYLECKQTKRVGQAKIEIARRLKCLKQ